MTLRERSGAAQKGQHSLAEVSSASAAPIAQIPVSSAFKLYPLILLLLNSLYLIVVNTACLEDYAICLCIFSIAAVRRRFTVDTLTRKRRAI